MKKALQIVLFFCIGFQTLVAQETVKFMFYNVLDFPDQQPASRIQHLATVLGDYRPDVFMICELNNESGAITILNTLQNINTNYQRAPFITNSSDDSSGDSNELQNMIFYDVTKFFIEDLAIVTTDVRDFNHYSLKLNTTDQINNPVLLEVFVAHLKASSGTTNQSTRLAMVTDLQNYFNANFTGSEHVMLAGDLNLYTSSEPAFVELLDLTNTITFIDPADRVGSWSNNTSYLDVFTQSTRISSSGLGGAGGGFDDRFDFILTSENMDTSPELSFVDGSYQVYGNNNNINCYNSSINSADCSGAQFSQSIRNALYNFSDHLPVTLELQTNQTLSNQEFAINNNIIELLGGNLVSDVIKLKVNNTSQTINQLKIYNVLGQQVKTIPVNNSIYIIEDISGLGQGMYYIVAPNTNMNAIKFIKVD